jgi:hypothetical protein
MFVINKTYISVLFLTLFSAINGFSQFYNKEIEAKIEVENNNEFINITGTALNKTELNESLRYTLTVFRTDPQSKNISKNEQSGRFVIESLEKKMLSSTTINANETDKVIILLLLYDIDDQIKGKDRIVYNDDGEEIELAPETEENIAVVESADVDNSNKDGIILKGIVIEDTKTKPGRDFYNMFYSLYNLNNINGEQVILIKEVLALGTNTKIEVLIDNNTIFEFFARPNNDYLKSMSDFAIRRVYQYFQQLKKQKEIARQY